MSPGSRSGQALPPISCCRIELERLRTGYVTPNFFDLLGVRPIEGRLFTSADETSDGGDVVALSHALWRTSLQCGSRGESAVH